MYAHFYHLSESPFNLTPDPKFHYVNESTREALASLQHGIRARKGFITLIAEAGTGKTTLLRRVVEEVEADTTVVFVFNPGVSFDELLEFICTELGIRTDSTKRLHLLERLNAYLLEQLTEGRNVVVMIDEAQTLEDSVLEELRLLSNLETSKEKILQIVLSGQPELEDKLRKPHLRQLRQRIGTRCTLDPMHADEIGAYVETRLRSAGAERGDFFTPVGLRKVWQASKGIPRVINAICDNAMMIAFAEGKQRIDSAVINEAVRDLQGLDPSMSMGGGLRDWIQHPSARYVAAAVLALAFIIPASINLYSVWRDMESAPGAMDGAEMTGDLAAADTARIPGPASPPKMAAADAEAPRRAQPPMRATEPARAAEASERAEPADSAAAKAAATVERALAEARRNAPARPAEIEPKPSLVGEGAPSRNVLDSMRQAELIAGSTAARIYGQRGPAIEDRARETATDPELPSRKTAGFVGEDASRDDFVASDDELGGERAVDSAAVVEKPQAPAAKAVSESPLAAAKKATEGRGELSDAVERLAMAASNLAEAVEEEREQPAGKQAVKAKADAKPESTEKPEPAVAKAASKAEKAEKAAKTEKAEKATKIAAIDSGAATLGPRSGKLIVGQHVRVQEGDTVWDIAIGHYGTAGPSSLTRILNNNPGISDPRSLQVGAHVYVPFERAEDMIKPGPQSTYRVLLTVSPRRETLEATRDWLRARGEEVELGVATVGQANKTYHLYAVGITDREAALRLAEMMLAAQSGTAERTV